MSERIKVKLQSVAASAKAYEDACAAMGLHPNEVPPLFIDLAGLTSRLIVESFCAENNLELEEQTLEETLKKLKDAGMIDGAEEQRIRERIDDAMRQSGH